MRRVGAAASALLIAGCGSGGSGAANDSGIGDASALDGAFPQADAASVDGGAGAPDAGLPACGPSSPPADNMLSGMVRTLSQNTGPDPDLDVEDFYLSPDSTRVLFRGDLEVDGVMNLYSVPIEGGQVVSLTNNDGPAPSGFLGHVTFTPDGSTVLWMGEGEDEVPRLHKAPVDGGATTTLSPDTGSADDLRVWNIALSPDAETVVFRAQTPSGAVRLYSVPVDGGDVVPLSQDPGSDGFLDVDSFAFTPDGSTVVFAGDVEIESLDRIYSVPVDGGTVTQLSPDDGDDSAFGAGTNFFVTPDGSRVVFSGVYVVEGQSRAYSVPVGGGSPVQISPDVGFSTERDFGALAVSGDSTRAVLRGDDDGDGKASLFSVEVAGGGTATPLSPGIDLTHFGYNLVLSPDGDTLVYAGISQADDVQRLYSIPVTGGGSPTVVSQNTILNPDLSAYFPRVSPDSSRVAYAGDAEIDGIERVYVACLDGTGHVTLSPNDGLDPDLGLGPLRLDWTPDGHYLFFTGDMITDEETELYRATAAAGDPVSAASEVRPISEVKVSPDGAWVVFETDAGGAVRLQSRDLP